MSRPNPPMSMREAFDNLPQDFIDQLRHLPDGDKGNNLFIFASAMLGEKVKEEFPLQQFFKNSALGRWQEATVTMLCLYYPFSEILKFFNDAQYAPKAYKPIDNPKDMMIHAILISSLSMIRVSNYWGSADSRGDLRGVKYALGHAGVVGVNKLHQGRSGGQKGGIQTPELVNKKKEFVIRQYEELMRRRPKMSLRSAAENIASLDIKLWTEIGMSKPWGVSSIRACISEHIKFLNKMAK